MSTVFTKIINGDIPSYKIAEDDKHYAMLDISPLAEGHTLVITKREVDYIFDLEDEEIAELNVFAKKVALGIEKAIECKRVGSLVIGTEVPHTHIHLIPFKMEKQMAITSERLSFTDEKMKSIAERIRREL